MSNSSQIHALKPNGHRTAFRTEHYKHDLAQEARAEYQKQLNRLFDDKEVQYLLYEHTLTLKEEITRLRALHEYVRKHGNPVISPTKIQLINKEISTLQRAHNDIVNAPDRVISKLRSESRYIMNALNDPDKSIFSQNGRVANRYLQQFYRGSREETQQRFAEMDYWYAAGQEFALERFDREDRAYEIALIPKPIQHAKWKFMLALADVAYNISMKDDAFDEKLPMHQDLIARLLSRLSTHERGADNQHMPYSHKLRHNPAIHSLHVVALADKIFHTVEKQIKKSSLNGKRDKFHKEWQKLRNRVMLMALMHDMGELDGELSQGIDRAHMKPEDVEKQKVAVHQDEKDTFARHLEQRRQTVACSDIEWQAVVKEYTKAFNEVDNLDIFVGRFVKALEQIQSQHDYLRFEGINDAPLLREADEDNRNFSLNYVSRVLFDASHDFKAPGKNALRNKCNDSTTHEKNVICTYLCHALEEEYQAMFKRLQKAFEPVPEHLPTETRSLHESWYPR